MARSGTMRSAVIAAIAHVCCASGECTLDKWSMPPQTLEGSGTMVTHTSGGKLGNTTVPPTNQSTQMNIFQSFDYQTMNMATRVSQNMSQGPIHFQMESDAILNWKAGLMTTHMKSSLPNQKVQEHCKTIKLPLLLRFLPIGQIMKKIKDMEAAFFKCVGHHDDLDSFAFSTEFPPKWLPKTMTGKMPRVNLTMDMDVDAAGLLKSYKLDEGVGMDININVNDKKETWHSETRVLQDMTVSKSRPGGPSKKDLEVPADWGDCSTVHMPELEDLLAEWERSDSAFFGHTRIIPHTLRAMAAEARATVLV
jgi:hypothetical protein